MNKKFKSLDKYLDFKDVLILPKNSTLNSRSEVNLNNKITFKNDIVFEGVPIISANMTTVGTLNVYKTLSKYKIITALHKFHTLKDIIDYNSLNSNNKLDPNYFMLTTGISGKDYENIVHILDNIECKFILVDIANGYIQNIKDYVSKCHNL